MNIYISGGSKNQKSMLAQIVAKKLSQGVFKKLSQDAFDELNYCVDLKLKSIRSLYYVATMKGVDEEDMARIKRHIEERSGWGFQTIEWPNNIDELATCGADLSGVFLLDSITALMSNEMFGICREPLDDDEGFYFDEKAGEKIARELIVLMDRITEAGGSLICVSDNIFSDCQRFDEFTKAYLKGLALVDRKIGSCSDMLLEVNFSNISIHKGKSFK